MVARKGSAPPTSGCRPDMILFHHRAFDVLLVLLLVIEFQAASRTRTRTTARTHLRLAASPWIRTRTNGVKAWDAAVTPRGKWLGLLISKRLHSNGCCQRMDQIRRPHLYETPVSISLVVAGIDSRFDAGRSSVLPAAK